jgi:hypothetical protein
VRGCGAFGYRVAVAVAPMTRTQSVFTAVLLFTVLYVACGPKAQATCPSPDGAYVASILTNDQGALGGDMWVEVRVPGRPGIPWLWRADVFSSGDWHALQLKWLDARTLEVECSGNCNSRAVHHRREAWRDIRIAYSGFDR